MLTIPDYRLRKVIENVAAIVGMAKAMELAELERKDFSEKTYGLRSALETGIIEKIENVLINGHPEKRLQEIPMQSDIPS